MGQAMPRCRCAAASSLSAGRLRNAVNVDALIDPPHAAPSFSAVASPCMFSPGPAPPARIGPNDPPLSEIARWKSPLASGEAASWLTAMPPADSPKIVTLPESPPKAAMFFCTHQSRNHVEQTVVARHVVFALGCQLR